MKIYGANKATEFTKKQISVVFRNAKEGNLKVEKHIVNDFYNLADYYGYDDSESVERAEFHIMQILDDVFAGDFEKAQNLIDRYTERAIADLTPARIAKLNRELV